MTRHNLVFLLIGAAAGVGVGLAIAANVTNATALSLAGGLSLGLLGWGAVWFWRRKKISTNNP